MIENATLFIKGTQYVDGEKDVIEMSSEGTVEKTDKGLRLCYEELSEEGENTKTVLTLIGETVNISREGGVQMNMTVQKGKHRKCTYASPMGQLFIGTYGTKLSKKDSSLELAYDLDINSSLMSKNELEIKYIIL